LAARLFPLFCVDRVWVKLEMLEIFIVF
jgi:hypothetical protein